MMFEDILEQEDTDCQLRAVTSFEAISELEPGQITGYLSAIFRDIIKLLAEELGYDPSNVQAAPVCVDTPTQRANAMYHKQQQTTTTTINCKYYECYCCCGV
jgi:hypothetical protein